MRVPRIPQIIILAALTLVLVPTADADAAPGGLPFVLAPGQHGAPD